MNVTSAYIQSFLNGTLNTEEQIALRQWIGQSQRNRKYFADCLLIWKATAIAANEAGFDVEKAYNRFHADSKRIKRFSFYPHTFKLLAAVILLLFMLSGSLFFFSKLTGITQNEVRKFIVEVPSGAKSKVTLPDGSVVWLNSESKIEYDSDFAKSSRNVSLSGEGYFEVSKNKNVPFVVKTEKLFVKVLGTKFNLKSYEEDAEVKVTLKEGAVKVEQLMGDTDPVTLEPNQQVTYRKSEDSMQVDSVDASSIEAWRDGLIVFDKVSLIDIARELKRLYDVPIQIEDENLKHIIYYSDFKNNIPIEKVIEILSAGSKFNYEVKPDYIRIYN